MKTLCALLPAYACALLMMTGCDKKPAADAVPATADKAQSAVLELDDTTFAAQTAQGVVLVDFWAPWCGPCKMIAPILDEVAQEYTGKVVVAKLNIDENPAQPPKFGVRGIPTLMLLKGGQVVATRVGALSKSQLTDFLNSNLA